jgi:hypothetical protein
MTKLYPALTKALFLLASFVFFPALLFSFPSLHLALHHVDLPITEDSIISVKESPDGHLRCVTKQSINCQDKTVQLGAFLETFTGMQTPLVVTWTTGETAQKIIVSNAGTYSWDATGFGCDHFLMNATIGEFFDGNLSITGPPAICPGYTVDITVNTDGYTFSDYTWNPSYITDLSPVTITAPGTYRITMIDDLGCPYTASIVMPLSPPVVPLLSAPTIMCSQSDTAVISVAPSFVSYAWDNGETTNPIQVYEPGFYEVVVTNIFGCTGSGVIAIQNGDPDLFNITPTSPSICPGELDTLRAFGPFSQYSWSTGATTFGIVVNQPGTYSVTVTNSRGCTGSASITIPAKPTPVIDIQGPAICPGDTAVLTATGGFPNMRYLWSTGDTTKSISSATPGIYSVTVTGNNICPDADTVVLKLAPGLPTTQIAEPPGIDCFSPTISLDGSGSSNGAPYSLNWSTTGGNFVSGQNTLLPVIDRGGVYILQIIDTTTLCATSDTVVVGSDLNYPQAEAGNPTILTCSLPNYTLGAIGTPADSTLNYAWTTLGGNFVSGQNTANPVVNAPGLYILEVSNPVNGCSSSDTVSIAQDIAAPVVAIAQPDTINCIQSSVTLNASAGAGANLSFLWTTANGSILSGADTPAATVSAAGDYTVLVTNTQNGCTAAANVTVLTDANIPTAIATAPDTLDCNVLSMVLNGNGSTTGSGIQYSWTTANGNIVSGATTLNPSVNQPGAYTLTVLNTNNNCSASFNVQVVRDVLPPVANAGADLTLNCAQTNLNLNGNGSSTGPNFTASWTTSNGNILSGQNTLNPLINEPGSYTVVLVNIANGCTASDNVTVFEDVTPPAASIAQPSILNCFNSSVPVNGSASSQGANFTYQWTGPAGGIVSGQGAAQIIASLPGVYQLLVTNTINGCTSTAQTTVSRDITPPPALAGPDQVINCSSPTRTIGSTGNPGSPNFTLSWTTANGNILSGANGPTPLVDQGGAYTLTVVNLVNGCTSTDIVNVTEDFIPPVVNAGPGFQLSCTQPTFQLQGSASGSSNLTALWSSASGNIVSGANTLTPTINASGVYVLTVTNLDNGCTAQSQVTITQSNDVPVASIATPALLTCVTTNTQLNATASSTGPNFSYTWATANGNIVSGISTTTPQINAPGVYSLTVTDLSNNCTAISNVTVNQNIQKPVVDAGQNPTLTCAVTTLPLQAQIVSSASTNINYAWTTAGGQILSGANTASPTIGAPGAYTVLVTDALNGCTGTDQVTVLSNTTPPVAAIAAPNTLNCNSPTITLNAAGSTGGNGIAYTWTTVGGSFASLADPLAPVVDEPGTYILVVLNAANGCRDTFSVNVPQDIAPPTADAGATNVLTCTTTTLTLNGGGSSQGANFTYSWTTQDGQILSGATSLSPQIGEPGAYTLLVRNTINGCTATDAVVITENITPPAVTIAPPAVLTCIANTVSLQGTGTSMGPAPTFTWTTGNGNILSGANQLIANVNAAGVYTLTILNTVNGCSSNRQVTVTEDRVPPVVQTNPAPKLTCTVTQVTLNSTVAPAQAQISWSTASGQILSGGNTLTPTVGAAGIYQINATSPANGCTAAGSVTVVQEANIPSRFDYTLVSPNCLITRGEVTFDLVVGGIPPYLYSIDGGQQFGPAPVFSQLNPGDYVLAIQDANGCERFTPITIPAPIQPDVDLPPSFVIELGDSQQLESMLPTGYPLSNLDTVVWEPSTGLEFSGNSIAELLRPIASPTNRVTEYTVTIFTPEGCKASARTLIWVKDDVSIYVPNVIMPDDPDRNNSVFQIFADDKGIRVIRNLQVHDRWGELVFQNKDFQPNDLSAGWTGDFRGETVVPAVFVWWAEVELINGEKIILKGDVTVVR